MWNNFMELMNLLFDNIWSVIILISLVIFREGLGSILSRLRSLYYKGKDKEISVNAEPEKNDIKNEKREVEQKNSLPEKKEIKKIEEVSLSRQKVSKFQEVMKLFKDGSIEQIKNAFEEYALNEKDIDLRARNKHVYLYFLFSEKQYMQAIEELESLAEGHEKEKNKIHAYNWLSLCYQDLSKSEAIVKLWEKATSILKDSKIKTESIVYWAKALKNNNNPNKAKELLIERLNNVDSEDEKALIYKQLFHTEMSLNNTTMACYCRDKALEYDVMNTNELFDSAYEASEEDIEFLSIINYKKLLDINPKHEFALNNLGVKASENDLNIIAIKNYEKAEKEKNTLAMANKANRLLDAGFIEEAKKIANEAVEIGNPHKNIYSLLSTVDSKIDEEETKWKKIINDSETFQKNIRRYVSCYYTKSSNKFSGKWVIDENTKTEPTIKDNKIYVSWIKIINEIEYTCSLEGNIENSSFSGIYKVFSDKEPPSKGLLSLSLSNNKTINVLGYIPIHGKSIFIFEDDYKSNFSMNILNSSS